MAFFTVWWFDLLLGAILALQVLTVVFRREANIRLSFTIATIAFEIGSVVALLFLQALLTDVLIVLMLCALLSAVLALVDNRLQRRDSARVAEEIPEEEKEETPV